MRVVPRRTHPSRAVLVAALVVAMCAGFGAPTRWHPPHGAVEIDVIGDSLSTGIRTPSDPWTREAEQLYRAEGRDVVFVNEAENGAGYVTRGQYGDTFGDEVDSAVTPRADIVLLFGSDNDLGRPGLAQGVAATLQRVRTLAPRAQLIVVGPPAPPAQQPAQLAGLRDQLEDATERAGGRFVDALALGWFAGDSAADVASDAEHPNAAGEQFLARQMLAVLAPAVDRYRIADIAVARRR